MQGMIFVGRELRRKPRLVYMDSLRVLRSNQILGEVHVDDPALRIENDK